MPEIDLPVFLADRLRSACAAVRAAVMKMPDDRIRWRPPVEGNRGRSALDQVFECAYLNAWMAAAFRTGILPPFDAMDYTRQKGTPRTREAVLQWLQDGTDALAAAVEVFPPRRLGETFPNPFTGKMTNWAELADFFYWNTVYHEGQINYIQTLYGDKSFP